MKMEDLKIDIYADGADINTMVEMNEKGFIRGFTTNPTLMKKAGVKDYTLTVPKGTTAIQLEALQANYWAIVTYKANGQTYKVLRDIPVQVGTIIEISSEFKEFVEDPSPSDTDQSTAPAQRGWPLRWSC